MRRSVVLALCAATLWSCSSSVGWAPGRCVRVYDVGSSLFLSAKVLTTRGDGVVVLEYDDKTWGDSGIGLFDPADPRGKRLVPCPAVVLTPAPSFDPFNREGVIP